MQVTEYNVGRWCLSEDECIVEGIDFAAYERGIADAAKAFGQNAALAAAAVAAERERCAKVCDDLHHKWRWDNDPDSDSGPRECAAAIRSRHGITGEQP
jgi:hypothetical protein